MANPWTCPNCQRRIGAHTIQCLCGEWDPSVEPWTCMCGAPNIPQTGRCFKCKRIRPLRMKEAPNVDNPTQQETPAPRDATSSCSVQDRGFRSPQIGDLLTYAGRQTAEVLRAYDDWDTQNPIKQVLCLDKRTDTDGITHYTLISGHYDVRKCSDPLKPGFISTLHTIYFQQEESSLLRERLT